MSKSKTNKPMQPGDILVANSIELPGALNTAVRSASSYAQGGFNHVAMYVGNGDIVESRVNRGTKQLSLKSGMRGLSYTVVRPDESKKVRSRAALEARKQVGKSYSASDMLRSGAYLGILPKSLRHKMMAHGKGSPVSLKELDAVQCAALVEGSYRGAGTSVVPGDFRYVTPVDFMNYGKIIKSKRAKGRREQGYGTILTSAGREARERFRNRGFVKMRKEAAEGMRPSISDIKSALDGYCKKLGLDPKKAYIVAGGAMYIHGLRDTMNDIDFIHEDLKKFTKANYGMFEMDGGPGSNMSMASKRSKIIKGVRVQTPEAILSFYKGLNRPKDQEKIVLMTKYINGGITKTAASTNITMLTSGNVGKWVPDPSVFTAIDSLFTKPVSIHFIPRSDVAKTWSKDNGGKKYTKDLYSFRAYAGKDFCKIFVDDTETRDSVLWVMLHELAHIALASVPYLFKGYRVQTPDDYWDSDDGHERDPEEQMANNMAITWMKTLGHEPFEYDRRWWRERTMEKSNVKTAGYGISGMLGGTMGAMLSQRGSTTDNRDKLNRALVGATLGTGVGLLGHRAFNDAMGVMDARFQSNLGRVDDVLGKRMNTANTMLAQRVKDVDARAARRVQDIDNRAAKRIEAINNMATEHRQVMTDEAKELMEDANFVAEKVPFSSKTDDIRASRLAASDARNVAEALKDTQAQAQLDKPSTYSRFKKFWGGQ